MTQSVQNRRPSLQGSVGVLDHRAQASEISTSTKKRTKTDSPFTRKSINHLKSITSFTANCDSSSHCTVYSIICSVVFYSVFCTFNSLGN